MNKILRSKISLWAGAIFDGLVLFPILSPEIGGMIFGILPLPSFFLPLSAILGNLIGNTAFRTPLPTAVAPLAFLAWTGIVISGSIVATLYPARRAGRLTTREALSHE